MKYFEEEKNGTFKFKHLNLTKLIIFFINLSIKTAE